ncbi:hypothetical protein [Paraburkholderia unamae]|uniref:Uncharacterized protein n=1 Tax=Paraburkholderia unamae TaxID=219649 RepID=A0ABX5KL60_9BURK|nr:hypothetical protein [Paraburkholderia unamae]PVX77163.1 hypothetical protein C7402_115222 [Paraburkholderia unamae]
MNYFGFTSPQISQVGAGYASNPMSSGTVGMGTLSGMANPMMQMAANGSYGQGQAQNASQPIQSSMLPQLLAMQQMQQMGQPSRTPQSTLGSMAQMAPSMVGLMAQNPQLLSGLGGLLGGA